MARSKVGVERIMKQPLTRRSDNSTTPDLSPLLAVAVRSPIHGANSHGARAPEGHTKRPTPYFELRNETIDRLNRMGDGDVGLDVSVYNERDRAIAGLT